MSNATMKPKNYRARIADKKIEHFLSLFGAVEISGVMWSGKTWSALAHSESVIYLDKGSNKELTEADPEYALIGEKPHLIDEWQLVPKLWDTIRHAADTAGGEKGKWIITGSSAPDKSKLNHSGAGRIGSVRMRTMTLAETGESSGKISLKKLFDGEFTQCEAPVSVQSLAEIICRGGWPEMAGKDSYDAQTVLQSYLDTVFNISIPRLGGDTLLAKRTALSVARNLCQSVKYSVYAKDVYGLIDRTPDDTQQRNVSGMLNLLASVYLTEEIHGWVPATRSPARMRTKPKRYFSDPSIAVSLLGMSEASLLKDFQTFGLMFENMVIRDLSVYAAALPGETSGTLCYYRDDSDLEADAIIERKDGSYAVIEIKLSTEKTDAAADNIKRLIKKVNKNPLAQNNAPAFCAIITGTGDRAYKRSDGIYVIPIRALGP